MPAIQFSTLLLLLFHANHFPSKTVIVIVFIVIFCGTMAYMPGPYWLLDPRPVIRKQNRDDMWSAKYVSYLLTKNEIFANFWFRFYVIPLGT